MTFIGRARERQRILREFNRSEQNVTLVFGRRRVGKSELILQCLHESSIRTVYYECRQTTEANNVKGLAEVIGEAYGMPPFAFEDIESALRHLFDRACEEKIVLALDEYPFLRKAVAGMDSILQSLIDKYRDRSHLSLVICGSYVDTMRSLLEKENPLYGRIDATIDLKPMDYYESSLFYPGFSPEDKVRLYSVFDGIPYYNRLIDPSRSVRENLLELIVEPGARLENEVSAYLLSEISKITNANEVFGTLAAGYSRYKGLLDQSHVSSGPALVNVLDKLTQMELVQKRSPINDPSNRRKSRYVIIDGLSKFYYRYIYRYLSQRAFLNPDTFYDRFVAHDFETRYVPHAFEEVCRQFLIRQNRAGKLPESFDLIGTYYYDDPVARTNGEFDVVTHDPNGYIFYEAKFRGTPITEALIREEIEQVERTGLSCYRYGFFSRSGFATTPGERTVFYDLDELYAEDA